MNYYPNNYYLNYPYGNQYQQQIPYNSQTQPIQPQGLNGKIVDSQEVVKATEVPIGGYGIFPKADLSEIYIKSWNNNGTTSVIVYKPEPPQTEVATAIDPIAELKEQINVINVKLDNILAAAPVKEVTIPVKKETPVSAPKKEVLF
jgi:hypothetical protein